MKLIWIPEHIDTRSAEPACLALHGGRWVSAPAPTAGERCIAVVPASVYQWHVIDLPKLPRSKWQAAAASVIEPKLMQDIERCVFHVLPRDEQGQHAVAVIDREWVAAAQNWLNPLSAKIDRWVPESSLLQPSPAQWMLFQSAGDWVLASSAFDHYVLDQSPDNSPPLMMRAALETHGVPREVQVAGLPTPPHLAERHTPQPPLWLAALGLRAQAITGTDWLTLPGRDTPDFSPEGSGRRRWALPRLGAWRTPLIVAGLALTTYGAGLGAQYLQWRAEAATLKEQIAQNTKTLETRLAATQEPASHVALAQHLARLTGLGLAPPAITRLEFNGKHLTAELDKTRVDLTTLTARVQEQGGTLVPLASGNIALRLNPAGGSK